MQEYCIVKSMKSFFCHIGSAVWSHVCLALSLYIGNSAVGLPMVYAAILLGFLPPKCKFFGGKVILACNLV